MTLPSSGTLYLSQIQSEFGGSNPIYMSEYYGAASGVPTSGTIYISHFYGKSNIIREPTSGYNYRLSSGSMYRPVTGDYYYGTGFQSWGKSRMVWNGVTIWYSGDYYTEFTQVTASDGWTYVKGTLATSFPAEDPIPPKPDVYVWRVYRFRSG